jgi:beta-1,4-mannooligosaccharide/beta-1,4-mannosyl-N-acetylglucosamine phosphorylase
MFVLGKIKGIILMKEVKLIGSQNMPNIPWQDRPAGNDNPVWRHSDNPVIKRNPAKGVERIFNSAVIAYEGSFLGVFRVENNTARPHLRMGHSVDGLDWRSDTTDIHDLVTVTRSCAGIPHAAGLRM